MGREIRRVPPHWEHPKKVDSYGRCGHQPLFDESYAKAKKEWDDGLQQYLLGTHPDLDYTAPEFRSQDDYVEQQGPSPDPEYYRPDWKPEEMTWYQVYETVSEGTPVTPPFETREELVEYLVANGDFWDQERRKERRAIFRMPCDPWKREDAVRFVFGEGYAPSFIMDASGIHRGHEH